MKLWELFFPGRCVFCREILPQGETDLCPECRRTLPRTGAGDSCRRGESFHRCFSPLYYTGNVRKALLRYKFSHRRGYAPVFARLMAGALPEGMRFDAVTWVPVSFLRRRKRGYDQAKLLAAALARELGLPLVRTLRKVRHNPAQSGLTTLSQRRANVAGVYRAVGQPFHGKLLLVDDIMTSGATLGEAARVLRTAGTEQIACVTAACAGRRQGDRKTG